MYPHRDLCTLPSKGAWVVEEGEQGGGREGKAAVGLSRACIPAALSGPGTLGELGASTCSSARLRFTLMPVLRAVLR